jgi:hypothetical protein
LDLDHADSERDLGSRKDDCTGKFNVYAYNFNFFSKLFVLPALEQHLQ